MVIGAWAIRSTPETFAATGAVAPEPITGQMLVSGARIAIKKGC